MTSLDTRRPFTRADARAAGISPTMLRGSRFRRVFRDVYVRRETEVTTRVRAESALLIHPRGARVSHLTAAALLGLPVRGTPDVHITVDCAADRRRRDGIVHHVRAHGEVSSVRGLRVSAPCQLFCELAEVLDLVDLVVVGDALVRLHLVTVEELRAGCRASGLPGVGRARRAADLVRKGVDSPMETRLRLLLVLAGLPEPKVNHRILHADGQVRFRFDLSYPAIKLIVEYDGRQHRDDLDQWDHDIGRREWMDREGWRLVVVVARGIFQRPDETIDRVVQALRDRGVRTGPLSTEWQAHFPVAHRSA